MIFRDFTSKGDCFFVEPPFEDFGGNYMPLPKYVASDVFLQALLNCGACMNLSLRAHAYAHYYFVAMLLKDQKQYELALDLLKEAAGEGHNESLYAQIEFYEKGLGITEDHDAAEGIRKQCWEGGVFGWEHTH
jgi:hypothetical protein